MRSINGLIMNIKLFLTDVDGCLTDGGMYYTAEGDAMKRFCVYDGMGMVLLRKAGIACGILTSENSPIVKARAEKLHLDYLYLGVGSKDHAGALTKLDAAKRICSKMGIRMEEVCFVGDDVNGFVKCCRFAVLSAQCTSGSESAAGYPCAEYTGRTRRNT